MKQPSHIPTHSLFDIETEPASLEELYHLCGRFDRANVSPPGNLKNPETIEKWYREQEEAYPAKLLDKSTLNPALSRVCAIGYCTDGKIEIPRKCSEPELLEDYWARRASATPGAIYFGYNNHGYDDEFLLVRSFITGVPVPENVHYVSPSGYRSDRGTRDLSVDFWGEPNAMRSLELTSKACGGPGKNGDGARFHLAWNSPDPEEFAKACDYLANDLLMPAFVANKLRIPTIKIPDPVRGIDCLVEPRRRPDFRTPDLTPDSSDDVFFPKAPSRAEVEAAGRATKVAILASVSQPEVAR